MDYLAGIDLGSTSLKVVVYDLAGNAVAQAFGRRDGDAAYGRRGRCRYTSAQGSCHRYTYMQPRETGKCSICVACLCAPLKKPTCTPPEQYLSNMVCETQT